MNTIIHNRVVSSKTARRFDARLLMASGIFIGLFMVSLSAFADKTSDNVAYVDSVKNWGPWALDIEPAAGGITPPSEQPVWARDPKVSLRTNSIAALAPPVPPVPTQAPVSPTPTVPNQPTSPPPPPVTPPVGGPADGLF